MTKTWEDYSGPDLTSRSANHRANTLAICACKFCTAEVEARKRWAQQENRKEAGGGGGSDGGFGKVRVFETGANRDLDTSKLDFEGFLSPLVIRAFATFMHFNRSIADGTTRASDNWQKGIPKDVYMKSAWRHFFAFWSIHRGWGAVKETIVWAILGTIFNLQGYLHELLKEDPELLDQALAQETKWRGAARASAMADVSPPKP